MKYKRGLKEYSTWKSFKLNTQIQSNFWSYTGYLISSLSPDVKNSDSFLTIATIIKRITCSLTRSFLAILPLIPPVPSLVQKGEKEKQPDVKKSSNQTSNDPFAGDGIICRRGNFLALVSFIRTQSLDKCFQKEFVDSIFRGRKFSARTWFFHLSEVSKSRFKWARN